MRYEKDIGFARIFSNKKTGKSLELIFRNAWLKNKRIFRKTPSKFRIVICDTEREMKKKAKYYYKPRITATVLRDNTLVTRSPGFIEKIGKFSRKDFPKIVNHEMNHVFWNDFYNTTKPVWLLEGFACYAGENEMVGKDRIKKIIKEREVDYSILHYRYIESKFAKVRPFAYKIWGGFTRFIIKKHGAGSIVRLMNEYSKKIAGRHYDRVFKRIFRKPEEELFEDYLESLRG